MTPPRLVLDTNVLISALVFRQGAAVWLRHAWQAKTVLPLVSRETAKELIRVLTYPKFKLTQADGEDLLDDYLPWCETVEVPDTIQVPDCRDPDDLSFLKLAVAGKADALVTSDNDLLVLADDFAIPILTPTDFKNSQENL